MKVHLYIRVKLDDGSRPYCAPVYAKNHQLVPSAALVNGKREIHPEGAYYLRYLKKDKRVWESVGKDSQEALRHLNDQERYNKAIENGEDLPEPIVKGRDIDDAIRQYLRELAPIRSESTYNLYAYALRLFRQDCAKKTLESLTREDLIRYRDWLLDDEDGMDNCERTVAAYMGYLKTFFRKFDLPWPLKASDRVEYTELEARAYSKEVLDAMLKVADTEEADLIQFLLCTGARRQEIVHATWADINFFEKNFRVREKTKKPVAGATPAKKRKKWKPKDKEEGYIPLPDYFLEMMRARRARHPESVTIFQTPERMAGRHLLNIIKSVALRAGLNCGECYQAPHGRRKVGRCCSSAPVCHEFILHRFRKNFATMHHHNGISVRSIQKWLRHSSLETTLRYLAGEEDKGPEMREKINGTFAAFIPVKMQDAA